jgi:catechol 2,3-dioxygenase-like lactoylglutathione lyase family enzyme
MKLRVARHTDNLEQIKSFYIEILGFVALGHFENHDSYDGVFIGNPESDWHFEFTQSSEKASHHPDADDITVLYPESKQNYDIMLTRLSAHNVPLIPSKNSYWNENGSMFKDPDGFRIVISPLKIKS